MIKGPIPFAISSKTSGSLHELLNNPLKIVLKPSQLYMRAEHKKQAHSLGECLQKKEQRIS